MIELINALVLALCLEANPPSLPYELAPGEVVMVVNDPCVRMEE